MSSNFRPQSSVLEKKGWEIRCQVTLIEPAKEVRTLPGIDLAPQLRANLVISDVPATSESPAAARDEFLRQTKEAIQGLEVSGATDDVSFSDGVKGALVVLEFDVGGGRLRQTHVFRIDGERLTQIVATLSAGAPPNEEDELVDAALAYTPPTTSLDRVSDQP